MPNQPGDAYIAALLDGVLEFELSKTENELFLASRKVAGLEGVTPSPRPLQSVLGKVGGESDKTYFFSVADLSLDPNGQMVFARQKPDSGSVSALLDEIREAHDQLRQQFQGNLEALPARYSLYHLLFRKATRLAYSEREDEDVSLFDRNRVLAAVTACRRYDSQGDSGFLLVKGAVSGIQDFIYADVKSEEPGEGDKKAKLLRGRSFFVSMLNHTIAEYIVEWMRLEQANVVFVGGGHFNLLLPQTDGIKKQFKELLKQINLKLRQQVGMKLSLPAAAVSCPEDFLTDFSTYYERLNDLLEQEKQQKHQSYLKSFFFQSAAEPEFEDDVNLGERVPYAKYLIEVTAEPGFLGELAGAAKKDLVVRSLAQFGKFILMPKRAETPSELAEFLTAHGELLKKQAKYIKIICLNDTNFLKPLKDLKELELPIGYGFRFVGNYTPKVNDRVMMFEELAGINQNGQALNYSQLGVMRLDIDDLGAIFAKGLEPGSNFDRMACLSRELQLFFAGYFNHLAAKNHMYVTYSGGDDAFVIGSWINVLHFADKLHRDFRRFVCHNEHITLSGGIFMCHPNYPIVRFAKDAERLLDEEAKTYGIKNNRVGKNAVRVFEHTIEWPRYRKMMEFTGRLEAVTASDDEEVAVKEGDKIRRSLVRRLLNMIQSAREEDEFNFFMHTARLHGLMARQGMGHQKLYGSKEEQLSEANHLVKELLQSSQYRDAFAHYTIPIHYVLHKTRKPKED